MNPGPKPAGMDNLLSEEIWRIAEQRAIEQGALKAQGFREGLAKNLYEAQHGWGSFAHTALCQSRLRQWTIDILRAWGYNLVER
jgi:hypothetical protein